MNVSNNNRLSLSFLHWGKSFTEKYKENKIDINLILSLDQFTCSFDKPFGPKFQHVYLCTKKSSLKCRAENIKLINQSIKTEVEKVEDIVQYYLR